MPLVKVTNRYSARQRESALRITEVHALHAPLFHHGDTESQRKAGNNKAMSGCSWNLGSFCAIATRMILLFIFLRDSVSPW